jgi:hypothetical protein
VAELSDAGLADYPFAIVPPMGPTSTWADRKQFRRELATLVSSWKRRPGSAVYLLWADFGAGKTHALRYLQAEAVMTAPPCVGVYSDLPDGAEDFKEVYRQIIPAFPEKVLASAIDSFRSNHRDQWLDAPILAGDRTTPRVLWMLSQQGSPMQAEVARRWLRGEKLYSRESALLENVAAIKSADQAIRVLSTLCRIVLSSGEYTRLVLMLDEFQRIGQVSRKRIIEINAGISSVLNACPEGLAIFLSYSFGVPENIKYFVMPEVLSRVERQFNLPALTESESVEFIEELGALHALPDTVKRPFTTDAIVDSVRRLSKDSKGRVTPRRLMQCFTGILDGALLEAPGIFPVRVGDARRLYPEQFE